MSSDADRTARASQPRPRLSPCRMQSPPSLSDGTAVPTGVTPEATHPGRPHAEVLAVRDCPRGSGRERVRGSPSGPPVSALGWWQRPGVPRRGRGGRGRRRRHRGTWRCAVVVASRGSARTSAQLQLHRPALPQTGRRAGPTAIAQARDLRGTAAQVSTGAHMNPSERNTVAGAKWGQPGTDIWTDGRTGVGFCMGLTWAVGPGWGMWCRR